MTTPTHIVQLHASLISASIFDDAQLFQLHLAGAFIGGLLSTAFDPPTDKATYREYVAKWLFASLAGVVFAPAIGKHLGIEGAEYTLGLSAAVSCLFWWSIPVMKRLLRAWEKKQ